METRYGQGLDLYFLGVGRRTCDNDKRSQANVRPQLLVKDILT